MNLTTNTTLPPSAIQVNYSNPTATITFNSELLDGNYTAFGRVVDGMNVVEAIEQTPRTGEAPNTRIELKSIRLERKP